MTNVERRLKLLKIAYTIGAREAGAQGDVLIRKAHAEILAAMAANPDDVDLGVFHDVFCLGFDSFDIPLQKAVSFFHTTGKELPPMPSQNLRRVLVKTPLCAPFVTTYNAETEEDAGRALRSFVGESFTIRLVPGDVMPDLAIVSFAAADDIELTPNIKLEEGAGQTVGMVRGPIVIARIRRGADGNRALDLVSLTDRDLLIARMYLSSAAVTA